MQKIIHVQQTPHAQIRLELLYVHVLPDLLEIRQFAKVIDSIIKQKCSLLCQVCQPSLSNKIILPLIIILQTSTNVWEVHVVLMQIVQTPLVHLSVDVKLGFKETARIVQVHELQSTI